MNLPVALFSRVPFRDSFLGVKCRYKGGDLFKKCLGVPKETPFSRDSFSGVKGAKYSSTLVLFLAMIHSRCLVLFPDMIHSHTLVLSVQLIHSCCMIRSSKNDSFKESGTFSDCDSFALHGTVWVTDSFIVSDTFFDGDSFSASGIIIFLDSFTSNDTFCRLDSFGVRGTFLISDSFIGDDTFW